MDNRPIGIFDSGMGGLSVWNEIRTALPSESLVYFADGLNCPYGSRPYTEIREFSDRALARMQQAGIKMAVVACNTATAAAITGLREKYPFPIVGMEPAVKPAALTTQTGIIGILATQASLDGELYARTSQRYGEGIDIIPAVGEGFVDLVEQDMEESPEAFDAVSAVVEPLISAGADRLVLGCTHYNLLIPVIRKVVGDRGVDIVDSSPAIEKRTGSIMAQHGITASADNPAIYTFMTFAGGDYLSKLKVKAGRISGSRFE